MASPNAEKPATVATVNGLQKVEQLGGGLDLHATTDTIRIQYLSRRYLLTAAGAMLIATLAFEPSGRRA